METSANNTIPLTANNKLLFKQVSSQLKAVSGKPIGKNRAFQKLHKKIKIFIVDDDPLFLKGLELSVGSYSGKMEIQTFQTGEECLEKMKQRPDIVILDYYLNSIKRSAWDGLMILKQIKQFFPKTNVIMLSSQDSLSVAIECINNGAYDYISKSYSSFVRINNAISNILGNIELESGFFKTIQFIIMIIAFLALVSIIMTL